VEKHVIQVRHIKGAMKNHVLGERGIGASTKDKGKFLKYFTTTLSDDSDM
jgi:hypothetical protein